MLKRVRDLAGRARVRAQCPVNIRAFPASRIFRRARHAGSGSVIPCEVARDLIPLYADGAASEETRSLVGAHLAECKSCADYYRFVKMAAKKRLMAGRSGRLAVGGFAGIAGKIRRRRATYTVAAALVLALSLGYNMYILLSRGDG